MPASQHRLRFLPAIVILGFTLFFLVGIARLLASQASIPEILVQSGFGTLIAQTNPSPTPPQSLPSPLPSPGFPTSELLVAGPTPTPTLISRVTQFVNSGFSRLQIKLPSLPFQWLTSHLPKEKQRLDEKEVQPVAVVSQEAYALTLKQQQLKQLISETSTNPDSEKLTEILYAESTLGSQVTRNDNQYRVTTDNSGTITQPFPTGVYELKVQSIDGYDITGLPGKIVLQDRPISLLLGLKVGTGQVYLRSGFDSDPSLFSPPLSPPRGEQYFSVRLFHDKNNNQDLDQDEKLVPWAGVTLILERQEEKGFGQILR